MKHLGLYIVPLFLVLSGCGVAPSSMRSPEITEEPYPALNPYGNWTDVPDLGHVWRPAVAEDWRPFAVGQWVWTDRGWMWDSDEQFAWIVYHYGSWVHLRGEGWYWVPGYEWSPARVRWYSGDDFICWAPEPPPHFKSPMMFDPGFQNDWIIVPAMRFADPRVGTYRSSPPPGPTVGMPVRERERPPDLESVRRITNRSIGVRRTEAEDVRQGDRTVARVRVETVEPRNAVPAVREEPTPVPAVRPAPSGNPTVTPASPTRSTTPTPAVRPAPTTPEVRQAPTTPTARPAVTPGNATPAPTPVVTPASPTRKELKKSRVNEGKRAVGQNRQNTPAVTGKLPTPARVDSVRRAPQRSVAPQKAVPRKQEGR